ncbi:hypothetical protein IEQ34_001950 [Dendrobium chrysotoxum]|uniref:Uncharacterized protein n=1 Tax=Dendrobium chrysotoxum TaxID=161865 RepID=A0AAV7HKT0_DENCH|nr:hypothetical protein IEQ34_001950 [Dendrobium chrysotoxum]
MVGWEPGAAPTTRGVISKNLLSSFAADRENTYARTLLCVVGWDPGAVPTMRRGTLKGENIIITRMGPGERVIGTHVTPRDAARVNKFEPDPSMQADRSRQGSINIYEMPPNTCMGPGERVIGTHVTSKDAARRADLEADLGADLRENWGRAVLVFGEITVKKVDALKGKIEQFKFCMEERFLTMENQTESQFRGIEVMLRKLMKMQSKTPPVVPIINLNQDLTRIS